MSCRLTPKSCQCTPALRLAKTVVFCCPDQLDKRLADSKIESVRLLLPMYARWKTFVANVRANSTFVVATRQSQFVALPRGSAAVTHAVNNNGEMSEWGARSRVDWYVAGSACIVRSYQQRALKRNKRMLVVLACNIWLCLYDLPFCISPVFVAAGVADAATRIFQFILFLNMRLRLIIILLLSVTI